jgi:hypothetical protein
MVGVAEHQDSQTSLEEEANNLCPNEGLPGTCIAMLALVRQKGRERGVITWWALDLAHGSCQCQV